MKRRPVSRFSPKGQSLSALDAKDAGAEHSFGVLIISGLPIFAIGLETVIMQNFAAKVERVEKLRAALDVCRARRFEIILLGVTEPERSGLDVLPDFHKCCPEARVLLVSLLAEEEFAARALKAGAAGYILKSSSAAEVVRALKIVLTGGKYVSQAFAGRFAQSFRAPGEKPHELLSPREFEVFLRIARGSTMKEIASQLSLSIKTISTYHTHILAKLRVRNDAQMGEYALRHGLID